MEETAATDALGPLGKVPALLFVPCRTATRGQFPLNGTYFQTNEVFLDHGTLANPILVRIMALLYNGEILVQDRSGMFW